MSNEPLAVEALFRTVEALKSAAADLSIAAALADTPGMGSDVRVLAEAVELDLLAAQAVHARHSQY